MLFWGLLGAVIVELALLLLLLVLPAREEPAEPELDQSKARREDLLMALGPYSARKLEVEKAPHPARRERAELVPLPVPAPLPLSALRQPEPQQEPDPEPRTRVTALAPAQLEPEPKQEPDPEPRTRVTALPAPAQLEPEPKPPPKHRPVKPEAPRGGPQTAIAESCQIKLWRGYVKCQLYAALPDRPGAGTGFALSPVFRLRQEDTPTEQAAGALKTLIDHLEGDGWTVVSAGAHWYDFQLARSREAP